MNKFKEGWARGKQFPEPFPRHCCVQCKVEYGNTTLFDSKFSAFRQVTLQQHCLQHAHTFPSATHQTTSLSEPNETTASFTTASFTTFYKIFHSGIDYAASKMNWRRWVCFGGRKTDGTRETRRTLLLWTEVRTPELRKKNHYTVLIDDSVVMEITKNQHSTKIKQLNTATHQKGLIKTRKMRGRFKKNSIVVWNRHVT